MCQINWPAILVAFMTGQPGQMNAVKTSSYAVVKELPALIEPARVRLRGNLDNTPHPAALAGAGKDERQQVGSSS